MRNINEKKLIRIALVGQPNVGKSMLINSISNSKLRVGNFSGVTVEKKQIEFQHDDYLFQITDLPGSYSLNDYTIEEKVTKNYLEKGDYDIILNVLDSTNLERNLYLTTELLALDKKMVIALNMIDEADNEGLSIDENQLAKIIGKPCVKTSAKNKIGIDTLINTMIQKYNSSKIESKLIFSNAMEEEISNIKTLLIEKKYPSDVHYREVAIKLLQEDKKTYLKFHDEPIWTELQPVLKEALEHIYLHYNTKDLDEIFADEKNSFARGATQEVVSSKKIYGQDLSSKIDNILLNKVLGIPIFLFFMWGLFQLTFVVGNIPMDMIDSFFASLVDGTKNILGDNELSSLVADGAIAGVGAVILFVPNIVILFFGIALLETTGYMSRVAFLLDGFFHKFGLHGKSFIPLVSGFGCSVPAYMAARTLKNDRDRLLTLFIIGFMSCGARLPIYVLFTGAFFSGDSAGNILFLIYITGALLGLIAAKVLKITVFKSEDEPFVMEMPKYRLPTFKLIWHTVSNQALMYLKKAGTFILAASILIWFASNYPKNHEYTQEINTKIEQTSNEAKKQELQNSLVQYNLENSYLGVIGKFSQPLFAPLGFDWRMTVALETGLAAKEIVVSTLGILYGLGDQLTEESDTLLTKIKNNIPITSALSFIMFVMIYIPCLAASMVFAREAGGWKYLVYLFVFTTGTAWVLSFITYNITRIIVT
ncbi:ferrous iron transport protein B [Arcobacter nitrofigilis DSM 7299]|uniref:Ferrous iron transport protein B n=1 Tax=Arcobacter nitrofigilis (strain ATCC 33309 / DSM 7299 / CCUG 15893 / LMG 7604 / NCTC 12251 / CI) TaxID=572480 RepID=D5UZ96_ARCNC|nr:ferrous iron transport protein B [Arcobacter nitrofigilis]ADG94099.1 ferrous iron transport protein B [Arcobacter nitrofigilis DSM 7299]